MPARTTSSSARRAHPRRSRDVPAAAREALAFPLAGRRSSDLVTRGGSATIVIEQPVLPIPGAQPSPRHAAIAAVADELERLGVRRVTILVAGGLLRRTSPREIGFARHARVPAALPRARDRPRRRGRRSRRARGVGDVPLRVNRALVETDLVVTVTAAETVLHGGPAALLGATGRGVAAARRGDVAARAEHVARLAARARARAAARARASPVTGVSLVLDTPRLTGPFAGYPYDQAAIERLLRSRLRRLSPARARAPFGMRGLERLPRAARRPPPSSAARRRWRTPRRCFAATLFKGVELRRAARRDRDRHPADDAVPPARAAEPRERGVPRPRPRAAPLAERAPVAAGGTAILAPPLSAALPAPDADAVPRALLRPATGRATARRLHEAERHAAADERGARRLPRRPRRPSAAAVRRVARVRRDGGRALGDGADRRLPRRAGGAPARLRRRPRASAPRSRWRTAAAPSASAILLSPPYFPLVVGRMTSLRLAEVGLADLLVRLQRLGVVGEHDPARSRARSRGRPRRAPSARSARRAGSTFPAR